MLTLRAACIVLATALTGLLSAMPAASAASADQAYSVPHDAWAQFVSDANGAQGLATGEGVTVAVISPGVDPSLPALKGKVTTGPDYTFPPRLPLKKLVVGTDDALLITAMAPAAKILSLRAVPEGDESGATQFYRTTAGERYVADAIRYAADHRAQVIYLDAWTEFSKTLDAELRSAVNYALGKNAVLVAPEPGDTRTCKGYLFPGGLPGVIGVASVMLPGGPAPYGSITSVCNNSVVISGPGDTVPVPGTDTEVDGEFTSGTFTAGTATLIKARYPSLSPALVERALALSARYRPQGGYDPAVGFGVLDPYDAVIQAGKLIGIHLTAPARPGVTSASAHFGGGPPSGLITALPSAGARLDLYWALVGAGLALLLAAAVLAWRWRRRSP